MHDGISIALLLLFLKTRGIYVGKCVEGWYLPCNAEIMDFGYPQNLSPEILKLYITQEGVRSPFSSKVR